MNAIRDKLARAGQKAKSKVGITPSPKAIDHGLGELDIDQAAIEDHKLVAAAQGFAGLVEAVTDAKEALEDKRARLHKALRNEIDISAEPTTKHGPGTIRLLAASSPEPVVNGQCHQSTPGSCICRRTCCT